MGWFVLQIIRDDSRSSSSSDSTFFDLEQCALLGVWNKAILPLWMYIFLKQDSGNESILMGAQYLHGSSVGAHDGRMHWCSGRYAAAYDPSIPSMMMLKPYTLRNMKPQQSVSLVCIILLVFVLGYAEV